MRISKICITLVALLSLGCNKEIKTIHSTDTKISRTGSNTPNKKNRTTDLEATTTLSLLTSNQTPAVEFAYGIDESKDVLYSGRIMFEDNTPAANCKISVAGSPENKRSFFNQPYATAFTNEKGQFQIGLRDNYAYSFEFRPEKGTISYDRFFTQDAAQAPSNSGYKKIQVANLTTYPAETQLFTLKTEKGEPIDHASFYLFLDGKVTTVTALGHGNYKHENLPARSLGLLAAAKGFAPHYKKSFIPKEKTPIEIIMYPGGGTIRGTAATAEGTPITSGTSIFLDPSPENQNEIPDNLLEKTFITLTDEKGQYEISGLPSYSFLVAFSAGNLKYRNLPAACNPFPTVYVEPNQEKIVNLTAYPGRTIEGTIVDKETSTPLSDIVVSTVPYLTETKTDHNGYYKLDNIFTNVYITPVIDNYIPTVNTIVQPVNSCDTKIDRMDIPMIEPITISGTVSNDDGFRVPGAKITANNTIYEGIGVKFEATSDSNGHFSIKVPPMSALVFQINARGYTLTNSDTIKTGIEDIKDVRLNVRRGFTVTGKITDKNGKAIPSSSIQIQNRADIEIPVNNKGEFTLHNLNENSAITAKAPNYRTANGRLNPPRMHDGETSDGLHITLLPTGILSGKVITQSGAPLDPENRPYVLALADNRDYQLMSVSPTGIFSSSDFLKNTSYSLSLRNEYYKRFDSETSAPDQIVTPDNTNILITYDQKVTSTPQDEVKIHTAYVTVKSKQTGEIIRNAKFQFDKTSKAKVQDTLTTSGAYIINNITDYVEVGITAEGYYPDSLYITTGKDRVISRFTVNLSVGSSIVGRAIDSKTKNPLANLLVRIYDNEWYALKKSSEPVAYTTTNAEGKFLIPSVSSGELFISIAPQLPLVEHIQSIQVKDGTQLDLGDIPLVNGITLNGKIVSKRGTPRSGIKVGLTIQQPISNSFTGETNANGEFTFHNLIPGSYSLILDKPQIMQKLLLSEDELTKDVIIELNGNRFNGEILTGDKTLNGYVIMKGTSTGFFSSVDLKDNKFTFTDIIPGTYKMYLGLGGEFSDQTFTVEIPDKPEYSETFQMKQGTIKGEVVDSGGKPVSGANIILNGNPVGSEVIIGSGSKYTLRTASDTSGKFEIENVSPGSYDAVAMSESGINATKNGIIVGNNTVNIKLTLNDTDRAVIEHLAIDATTGEPVDDAICLFIPDSTGGFFQNKEERDDHGLVVIKNIPPGKYTLVIKANNYASVYRRIEVKSGDRLELEDALYPGGNIIWDIKTEDDSPLLDRIPITITAKTTETPVAPRLGVFFSQDSYTESGLPPGVYTGTAIHNGTTYTEEFIVDPAETTRKTTFIK